MPLPFICADSELIKPPISLKSRAFHQSYTQTTPKPHSSDSHVSYSAARSRTGRSNQNRLLKGDSHEKDVGLACCTLFCHCGICPKRRGGALENHRRQHHRFQ